MAQARNREETDRPRTARGNGSEENGSLANSPMNDTSEESDACCSDSDIDSESNIRAFTFYGEDDDDEDDEEDDSEEEDEDEENEDMPLRDLTAQQIQYLKGQFQRATRKTKRQLPNILITGTPGTGKTSLSAMLAAATKLSHINLGAKIGNESLYDTIDEEFDSYVLNEDKVCFFFLFFFPFSVSCHHSVLKA